MCSEVFYACHLKAFPVYTSKSPETATGCCHLGGDVNSSSRLRAAAHVTLYGISFNAFSSSYVKVYVVRGGWRSRSSTDHNYTLQEEDMAMALHSARKLTPGVFKFPSKATGSFNKPVDSSLYFNSNTIPWLYDLYIAVQWLKEPSIYWWSFFSDSSVPFYISDSVLHNDSA